MQESPVSKKYSKEEILGCIEVIESLVEDSAQLLHLTEAQRIELIKAAGFLALPDRDEIRKRRRDIRRDNRHAAVRAERAARANTGIRKARGASVFVAPKQIVASREDLDSPAPQLRARRNCYVCKAEYKQLHPFYDSMCPACADFNYQKRFQTAPLHGKVALITGSRLKIGYQATVMMLRAGARVIATTRFPVDSALRYAREEDYSQWADRLHIYGLDLRHTPSVEIFCTYIEQKYDRLDILINNAAQTVRRPPGFYAHLMQNESLNFEDLPEAARSNLAAEGTLPITWNGKSPGIGLRASAQLSQIPYAYDHALTTEEVFPAGKLDADLQQVDLRKTNSWRLRLGEIPTAEMLELQLVNAIAPFVLCNRLSTMMKRDNTGQKHIVNVSAMEGKFKRFRKSDRHPHTNMAKAALNMLTHTSASDLSNYGIFMNAVDTGWVTDEDPVALALYKQQQHDFQPPLDIVDGAARVCDPFFHGILTGKHWCGKFLKDYFPIDW
jgi:NAD(P)-dependent dehydrogenase (short-subunit alcohol dehydrogenase family)